MATYVSRSFNVLSSVSHSLNGVALTVSGSKLQVGADAVATESFSTGAFDALGAASTAQTAAQSYADGLAVNYDVAGAAAAAVSAAAASYDAAGAADAAVAAAASSYDVAGAATAAVSAAAANYDAAGTAATLIAAASSSYDVAGAAAAAVSAAAASYDVAGAADAAVAAAASSYDVAGAAATAVAAAALAVNVDVAALSADLDLSSTPKSSSQTYWYIDGGAAPRVVQIPGSASVDGMVMNFYNVGSVDLNFNTGVGVLQSVAAGNAIKAVAHGSLWYWFAA